MALNSPSTAVSFWPLCQQLRQGHFVDLTHPFDPNIPHFTDAKKMQVDEVSTIEKSGFKVEWFQFEGPWGTHVDAPSHMLPGGKTVDQISLKEMLLPLVVIDVHEKVEKNPDYILTSEDIISWEDRNGRIPQGAFVALRTDWSKRWPDNDAMHNLDEEGIQHSPGWGLDALNYLYEYCLITASGHETLDPDAGIEGKSSNWVCQRYILEQNHYQVELLTNLDQCPAKGALVICTFPSPLNASSFPARVFALCP
jgi:kynurenine formamidase